MHPTADERTRWITELLLLLSGTTAAIAVFSWTDLDLRVSRFFYDPGTPQGPWPVGERIPWSVLHQATPWLAAGLGFLGLGLVVLGMFAPEKRDLRRDGLIIVLSLALGPGLVINAVFKDNWKRPRPRQTITLGGDHEYVPPLRFGPAGKSFPCGHCSVGYACGAFSYVLRRRRHLCLATSVVLGSIIGFGRVAAGGHFASDVVFSAFLTYAVTATVNYAVVRIARRDFFVGEPHATPAEAPQTVRSLAGRFARLPRMARAGLVIVAGSLLVFLVLLATPFEQPLGRSFDPATAVGESWDLVVRVEVGHARLVLEPDGVLFASGGSYDGFGFPGARILESLEGDVQGRRLVYSAKPRGWFTDLEGQVILRIAAPQVAAVEVEVTDGFLTIDSRLGGTPPPDLSCRVRADALRLRGGLRRDQVRSATPSDRPRD